MWAVSLRTAQAEEWNICLTAAGTPETFFEDFAENGEVYSLCTAPDGSIYAGLKGLAVPGAEHGWLPVIYHISPEGKLLNSFTVGEREWNIVDSMATDAQGRLYMRMRMQEDGSYVRIYSAEGELIGTVADDDSYAVQGAGALGQGKDGKVYAAAQAVGNTTAGDMAMTLVSVDPESLRFVPVAGGENVICSADTIYPWKMVAAGVSETADFILWGYNGVDTYRLGETEFTRVPGELGDALRYGRYLCGPRTGRSHSLYRRIRRLPGNDGGRRGNQRKRSCADSALL